MKKLQRNQFQYVIAALWVIKNDVPAEVFVILWDENRRKTLPQICDPPIQKKGEYKVMEIKDKALKISGSVLKKMVEKEQQKKPGCMGFLHQPKRPAALKKTK